MKVHNIATRNNNSFKMRAKIIRMNPEKTSEWFMADRDFLNSTYQDGEIYSAIKKLKPENDLFVLRVGLPRRDNWELIERNNKFYTQNSYDMFVDIFENGIENVKRTYDLSEKGVELEFCNPMDEFELHKKGPCSKVLEFIKNLAK